MAAWQDPPATLMFADAPYGSGDGFRAARTLAALGALANDALIVIETDKSETPPPAGDLSPGLSLLDSRQYGRASLHFLTFAG